MKSKFKFDPEKAYVGVEIQFESGEEIGMLRECVRREPLLQPLTHAINKSIEFHQIVGDNNEVVGQKCTVIQLED